MLDLALARAEDRRRDIVRKTCGGLQPVQSKTACTAARRNCAVSPLVVGETATLKVRYTVVRRRPAP